MTPGNYAMLQKQINIRIMEEDIQAMEDLELSEMAEQELEIIEFGIPDERSFDVIKELIRRFREKLVKY